MQAFLYVGGFFDRETLLPGAVLMDTLHRGGIADGVAVMSLGLALWFK